MRKILVFLIVFVLFVFFANCAMADLYRWVDKDGNVHVTNTPPQNRGAKVEKMKETKRSNTRPDKKDKKDKKEKDDKDKKDQEDKKKKDENDKEKKEKRKFHKQYPDVKVELYITSWCPSCKKALAFFRSSGVSLSVYDIEKDQQAARRKNAVSQSNSIPVAVIGSGELVVVGYSEEQYTSALEASN